MPAKRRSWADVPIEVVPYEGIAVIRQKSDQWLEEVMVASEDQARTIIRALLARYPDARGEPRRLTLEQFAAPELELEGTIDVEVPEGMTPDDAALAIRTGLERVFGSAPGARRARLVLEVERVEEAPPMRVDDPERTLDMLMLVEEFDRGEDSENALATVIGWTPEQREEAERWAGAVHLAASDNDDVEVPPRPAHVAELFAAAPDGWLRNPTSDAPELPDITSDEAAQIRDEPDRSEAEVDAELERLAAEARERAAAPPATDPDAGDAPHERVGKHAERPDAPTAPRGRRRSS